MSRLRWLPGPIAVQMVVVVIGTLASLAIANLFFMSVNDSRKQTSENEQAARLSTQIAAGAANLIHVLEHAPGLGNTDGHQTLNAPLEADALLLTMNEQATAMHESLMSRRSLILLGAVWDTHHALNTFRDGLADAERDQLIRRAQGLTELSESMVGGFVSAAEAEQGRQRRVHVTAALAIAGATLLSAAGIGATTLVISRRLEERRLAAEREGEQLRITTAELEARRAELQALYQIMTEISAAEGLEEVTELALRRTRLLIDSDSVELRVLREGSLVRVGMIPSTASDRRGASLALGQGLSGTAAQQVRGMLLAGGGFASAADGECPSGIESAMVVPLLVHTRVVGTMSVWSRHSRAFDEHDLHVFEMMASNIAAAIVTAEHAKDSDAQAHTDPLTGLGNRRRLVRDDELVFTDLLAHAEPFAVAMVDIDHFKRFNDTYGHRAGDIALERIARTIKSVMREGDHAYRYGGEEFTVVLPGADERRAFEVLERLRQSIEHTPLSEGDRPPTGPVTVSIGFALAPGHGRALDSLIRLADKALYESKERGRNMVTVFQEHRGMHSAA